MSECICRPCGTRVMVSTPAFGAGYVTVFRNPDTHQVIDHCLGCGRHLYQSLTTGELLDVTEHGATEVSL